MQKTKNLIGALFLSMGVCVPSAFADVTVSEADLQMCFSESERINRLLCYDNLLGRSNLDDTGEPVEPLPTSSDGSTSAAFRYLQRYISSPYVTTEGIVVSLYDRASDAPVETGADGLFGLINPPKNEASFQELRLETDLFLVLTSIQDIGEEGAILLACENNITRLRFLWPDPITGNDVELRFWFSDNQLSGGPSDVKRVRLLAGGHFTETPRGLESIRLLTRMANNNRVQVTSGSDDQTRSMFFDTEALRQALPMLARHCAWSIRRF